MRLHAVIPAVLGLSLTACTVIDSGPGGVAQADRLAGEGRRLALGSYALPRKLVRFEVFGDADTMAAATVFDVRQPGKNDDAPAEIIVADPDGRFTYDVDYAPSGTSTDDIDVTIEDHLLATVTVSTDDKTAEIITNLAGAIARIARIAAGIPTPAARVDQQLASILIDPTDVESVAAARESLGGQTAQDKGIELSLRPEPRPIEAGPKPCAFSICYRPLMPVVLSFRDRSTGVVQEFVVKVPDPHRRVGIDLERSAFVKRDTVLTFTNGTLEKVDLTKPSEVAAASLLPLAVINAVFEGINDALTKLVGLETTEAEQQRALLDAQTQYLKSYESYLKQVDQLSGVQEKLNPGGADEGIAAADDPGGIE